MFRKKYTSEEIIAGLLIYDTKIYSYLDVEYRPKVIRYVRQNSGEHEDGKDIYQEAIYKVYISVECGKYDKTLGSFESYFMGIACKTWLERLRDRKRSVSTTSMDDTHQEFSDFDAAAQVEQDLYYRRVQAVRRCVARLNKDEQEMIHLFYFAKESLENIAEKMGITYEYARKKISHIRKKIREMLGDDPDADLQFA